MMNRYHKYKQTGIEWIGEIPERWEFSKAKYYFRYTTDFARPTGSTEFTDADRLYFDQLEQALYENDDLKLRAQNNPIENFKYALEDVFIQTLIDRMDSNQEIFDKIMENSDFKTDVKEWLTKKIYQRFNKKENAA